MRLYPYLLSRCRLSVMPAKTWRWLKATNRVAMRVVLEAVMRIINMLDILVGFTAWPRKKLRLRIIVMRDQDGVPVITPDELVPAIRSAQQTFKIQLNIDMVAYGASMIECMTAPAPNAALDVHCNCGALKDEFGRAGAFFAQHLAGWKAIPISPGFPLTVFIARSIEGKLGCSIGPLADYVTLSPDGARTPGTLAHEIGHACGLWHSKQSSNLMYQYITQGEKMQWWQKNLFRNSRHVVYW